VENKTEVIQNVLKM